MAEDKKTAPTPPNDPDRVPISNVWFAEAQDLPGGQVMGVNAATKPLDPKNPERDARYVHLIVSLGSFEVQSYKSGELVGVDLIPREQALRYKRVGDR